MSFFRYIFILTLSAATLASCTPEVNNAHSTTPLRVSAALQKTMCYGTCPSYNFEVLSDGRATLTVGRFAEDVIGRGLEKGNYTGQVALEDIDLIVQKAKSMGYFSLNDKYDDPLLMDLPAAISTIEGHYVYNRYGGPDLDELYILIERTMSKVDWQPKPDTAP